MTFWYAFVRLLPRKPLPALAALYWHLTRRKVRAQNRLRVASVGLPFAYDLWIRRIERSLEKSEAPWGKWASQPRFTIIVHTAHEVDSARLDASIRSIENQSYPFWTLVHGTTEAIEQASIASESDYVVPLTLGDRLSRDALFRFAETAESNPGAHVLYADQDELNERGRRIHPWFKPRWNSELFYAQDYLSRACVIQGGIARSMTTSQGCSLSQLLLRATSTAEDKIVHVPHVLVHVDKDSIDSQPTIRLKDVAAHLAPLGATCEPGPFETVKVKWPLPEQRPLVSIIIPTKDRIDLLKPCIESVMTKTDYAPFEILVVDNGSVEQRTADFLARIATNPNVRVLSYGGVYNFSAINNFAVREARGSYLCLLNNDTEVIAPEWLTEMMRYAVRPEVGAVGAKLVYDDGTIQHAGVVIGIGEAAGHAHRFQPANDPGYFTMAHVAQFVSAVTAACLVVAKRKFEAVGGLDAEQLAVAFNDVDFCLKIQAAGWRNVYVPHAVLVHHESKSRGNDRSPQNIQRFQRELRVLQERWETETYIDPLHNPNLDRSSETFIVSC